MNTVLENLKKYDKKFFVEGSISLTEVTRAARNYIYFDEEVDNVHRSIGWQDKDFLNGFTTTKRVQVTVKEDGRTKTVWFFDTIKAGNKTGYKVSSFRDCIEVQVSQETGNMMYLMIMAKAKELSNVAIEVLSK